MFTPDEETYESVMLNEVRIEHQRENEEGDFEATRDEELGDEAHERRKDYHEDE
jgi:hypothetical protein